MLASGEYKLTSTPEYTEANPSFRLVALTAAEREARLARMPPPKESPFFTTGKVLPSFKLRDLNGRKFNSQELAGKIVVLNFWFINCGPCRREIPDLNEVVQHYANRDDVVFLAVALDERDAIKQFVQQRPYNYALIPGGRYVAEKYGVNTFPTNLVLDREGKVVFHTQFHPNIKHFLQQAIDGVK